jgi:hypothetical protein
VYLSINFAATGVRIFKILDVDSKTWLRRYSCFSCEVIKDKLGSAGPVIGDEAVAEGVENSEVSGAADMREIGLNSEVSGAEAVTGAEAVVGGVESKLLSELTGAEAVVGGVESKLLSEVSGAEAAMEELDGKELTGAEAATEELDSEELTGPEGVG